MGLQKTLRRAAKANYARSHLRYPGTLEKVSMGVIRAALRLRMERKINALRATGMTRDEAIAKLAEPTVAEKAIEVVKPKRTRKKAAVA